MPQNTSSTQTLWNEGRVVGLSAYEVYVKQHELEDPTTPPASEREWLSSSLTAGASLLVHITPTPGVADDANHVVQISLPDDTKLCAANTIVASFFYGDAEDGGNNFAQYVKDYGQLIDNNETMAPQNGHVDAANLPCATTPEEISDDRMTQLAGYMRILDGVVLQGGSWSDSGLEQPTKDFEPDDSTLSSPPVLRLHVKGPIKQAFWMLLSGFVMRSVLQGETKLEGGCVHTENPSDGDFLGPQVYPWANKVVFSVPTAAVRYDSLYTRTIQNNSSKTLQDSAIIDMRDTNPATYYNSEFADTRVDLQVNKFVTMRDNTAVLTVYQRDTDYAPALFGTFVTEAGHQHLNPIDTVAPRTLKFFHAEPDATAADFEASIPHNFALIRDGRTYKLSQVGPNKSTIPVADAAVQKDGNIYQVTHTHGTQTVRSVAISDESGRVLPMTGAGGTISIDEITWQTLLEALGLNKKIDILGGLKVFKKVIEKFLSAGGGEPGKQYVIEITDTGDLQLVEFNAVDFTIEQLTGNPGVWAQHLVLGDGSKDARTVSLQDNTGHLFVLNPTGANDVLPNPTKDGTLTWRYMLQALSNEKRIDAVGTTLRTWRSALDAATTQDVYSVAVDSTGPHLVPTAKFPNFMQETVVLVPQSPRLFRRMVLDVFGYVRDTIIDGALVRTANMICTLSCFSGDQSFRGGLNICQKFVVDSAYAANWNRIVSWLSWIAGVPDGETPRSHGYCSVLFNCNGRSIYRDTQRWPRGSPVGNVRMAGYIPFDTSTQGVLYMEASTYGWGGSAGCVSSAAYQGSLALTQTDLTSGIPSSSGSYSPS